MQVSVIRGITLPGKPNELDTYVKVFIKQYIILPTQNTSLLWIIPTAPR